MYLFPIDTGVDDGVIRSCGARVLLHRIGLDSIQSAFRRLKGFQAENPVPVQVPRWRIRAISDRRNPALDRCKHFTKFKDQSVIKRPDLLLLFQWLSATLWPGENSISAFKPRIAQRLDLQVDGVLQALYHLPTIRHLPWG